MDIQRRRSPLSGTVVDAVLVDMADYDGACEIIRWCSGRMIGEDDAPAYFREAVIAIDRPDGAVMYAGDGDWIAYGRSEFFPVRPYVMEKYPHVTEGVNP